jgi:hypothetical protein
MVAEGIRSDAAQDIQEWARRTYAGRLTRSHFPCRILPTETKVKRHSSMNLQQNVRGLWQVLNRNVHKEACDHVLSDVWYGALSNGMLWKLPPENKLLGVIMSSEFSSPDEKLTLVTMCKLFLFYLWTVIFLYESQDLHPWHPLTSD